MDRRFFFKVSVAGSATATLAGCGNPENQLIRFIPDEQLIPGLSVWKPSICPLCPAGCGLLARVVEGDAEVIRDGERGVVKMGLVKKLEGNPAHPINRGRLCARGQAAIQAVYHPDRIAHPLKRDGERGTGRFSEISWEQALAELTARLNALAAAKNPQALSFLTRPLPGQRQTLVTEFLRRFGAPPPIVFEVFGEGVLRRANELSFGYGQLPTVDFARSRYVIAFGADALGTWNSPVAQSIGYGEMRQGTPGQRGKFVHVEARLSQTGANADEWVPAKSGTEGLFALGMAHAIMKSQLRSPEAAGLAGALIEGWSEGLPRYTPAEVAAQTGVAAERIERLAREFAERWPAVAIVGGAVCAHTNGLFNALAVNALNALVGSVGEPGGIVFTPKLDFGLDFGAGREDAAGAVTQSIEQMAALVNASAPAPIQTLLLNDANPVFGAPPAWRVKEALLKIPHIVSFGNFLDETSILADLILPDHAFLETWMDNTPESGQTMAVAGLARPVVRPLYQTRAMPDILLEVARNLEQPLSPPLPWTNYEEMLKAAFDPLLEAAGANWEESLQLGGWATAIPSGTRGPVVEMKPMPWVEPQFEGGAKDFPFQFLPFKSQAFLDGSLAHLPWLQELPDPMTTAMWSSWVEINPKTAATLGIANGDLVEITSAHASLRTAAVLAPGIAPDVLAMPVGQGHETFTRYASGRGANPIAILAPMKESATGELAWAATRVRISRVSAAGQLTLFAGGMRERDPEHDHR
ncbi:MAG TPA: molybdopterin-dependent oxidoreductase [Terriglobia bacterium]|nr:molybdopterin-dependent oxidoreductase [Terriglobia bacterium]